MNRYVVELVDGAPLCTVIKSNKEKYSMEGKELIQFLSRIDESIYGRKERLNSYYSKKEVGSTLIYIDRYQKKNIRIRHYDELVEPLKELYRENKRAILKANRMPVLKGRAVKGAAMGGIALALLAQTAGKKVDLENTATYDKDAITQSNEKILATIESEIAVINEKYQNDVIIPSEIRSIVANDDENQITQEEIDSIVNSTQLDVEAVYDQGINDRVDPYMDDIVTQSVKRGMSPNITYDLISQEYDGTNTNLTHVVFNAWKDFIITTHNYETNKDEKIVLTDTPEKYAGQVDITISREELKNPKTNIAVGVILLHYSIDYFNQNIPLGIQAYNNGVGGVDNIIKATSQATGKTREEILSDMDNTEWMNYTSVIEFGDPNYFRNVVKHIDQHQQEDKINSDYSMKYIDEDGLEQEVSTSYKLT